MNLQTEELLAYVAFAPAAFLIGGIVGQSIANYVTEIVGYRKYVAGYDNGMHAMADIVLAGRMLAWDTAAQQTVKPWWAFWR